VLFSAGKPAKIVFALSRIELLPQKIIMKKAIKNKA